MKKWKLKVKEPIDKGCRKKQQTVKKVREDVEGEEVNQARVKQEVDWTMHAAFFPARTRNRPTMSLCGHHSCAFSRRCAKSACRICYASVHRGCTDHCNCTTESKPLVASTILWRSLWAIHRWSETDWSTPIKRPAILVSFFSVSYNSNLRTLTRHHVKRGKVFHTALLPENIPRKETAYAKTRQICLQKLISYLTCNIKYI